MLEAPEVIVGIKARGNELTTCITLASDLHFTLPPDGGIWLLPRHLRVPEGFVSDGASVPRFFWRLLSPPIDPITLGPSIIHDWLYINAKKYHLTRKECDRWYYIALYRNGYPLWKCDLTYLGIRLLGWRHWEGD